MKKGRGRDAPPAFYVTRFPFFHTGVKASIASMWSSIFR